MTKIFLIIPTILILTACSSPATPEDIKRAIQECPEARSLIEFSLRDCFGITCSDPKPLTKRELQGFVSDCQKERENKADLSSPENLLKKQRAALAVQRIEVVQPNGSNQDQDAAQ